MELEYTINQPLHIVFDYLTDMQKFVSVHPIIYKMDKTGENTYKVFEKLTMLFIPIKFVYPAIVIGNPANNSVTISATVKKAVHIKMLFLLSEKNNQTNIKETVSFRSIFPVKPLMRKIFTEQHGLLFANIEKVK